ncbi:MAG: hypothetical protein HZA32_10190 [Opitutae bacterium]|nr:hypothetical protein [Opitutae bacterium]
MSPRLLRFALVCLGGLAAAAAATAQWDEWVDRHRAALEHNAPASAWRGKLTGRLALAARLADRPVADLIYHGADRRAVFAPTAQLFGDAEIGPLYLFAQARADRGLDAGTVAMQLRIDELALRWSPARESRFSVQAGKFATVFGSWARRHAAWDYPFARAPLAQESLTGLWDIKGLPALAKLEEWSHNTPLGDAAAVTSDERNRVPLMWGAVYAFGTAARWTDEHWDFALEAKNVGLSSRPAYWADDLAAAWQAPALAARLGWRPSPTWNFGVSWADGVYLRPQPETIAPGTRRGDYRQTTLGFDASFAWRAWQLWAEALHARFALPGIGDAAVLGITLEGKRRFTPACALAARAGWQSYEPVRGHRWGRDTWRVEAGPVFRLAAHAQVKVQASLLHERPAPAPWQTGVAVEWLLRF